MLKSTNFAIFRCLDCGNTIKIEPSIPVESVSCDCAKKPRAELKVEEPKPRFKSKPKKDK